MSGRRVIRLKGLMAAYIAAIIALLVPIIADGIGNDALHWSILVFWSAGTIVITLALLLAGLPVALVLEHYDLDKTYHYAVAALVPGPLFVFLLKPFGNDTFPTLLLQTAFCSLVGGIAALAYWYVAVRDYKGGGA